MNTFDVDRLKFVSLTHAMAVIEDGWLAQYRGTSWLSRTIQRATAGPHSHSAMLRRNNGTVDVLELRELKGGRARTLEGEAHRYSGLIDIFSVSQKRFPEFDGEGAVALMRRLTEQDYGYLPVIRIALRMVPFLWRFYPIKTHEVFDESSRRRIRPFCSHAVSLAYAHGGRVNPVRRLASYLVTPNHLTHSLLFNYEFTVHSDD
jgi:hypothetical protein